MKESNNTHCCNVGRAFINTSILSLNISFSYRQHLRLSQTRKNLRHQNQQILISVSNMSDLRNLAGSQFVAELVRLPSEELKDASSDQECIICRAEFGPKTEDAVQLPCRHVFDRKCLDGWLSELEAGQNTCPKCRTELFVKNDTPDSDITDFLAEYANSRTPFIPPEDDITEFLDQLGGIPASVAARLPPPSTTLGLFSGLSENATRILRQQYSDWFARQTQEVKDRFPNPSDLPIQPRDDSIYELGHNYGLAFFQQREEEDEAPSFRLPENHQFPRLDTPEGFDRVLERISGLTEENRNELRRTRAESRAQRQRQAGVGFGAYHADSSNASHNIPQARANGESHNRVEADNENNIRLDTADDYQHYLNRSWLSREVHATLQRDLAELGLNIPQARANENHNMVETDGQNNATLRTADGRRSLFSRSATSGEGRNRLPRNYAELRARLQRH